MTSGRIEVSTLTVGYRGSATTVLRGVDLVVDRGAFLALLGPSGCGKSTLLNTIAGFVQPVAGEVLFNGLPVVGPSRERGVVFQRDVLFPWASVQTNIGFALRAAKVPRAQRCKRTVELLEDVGLSPSLRGRLPHELSGGMRQRVGIARALASNPDVLLMDEPFGALDALTRSQMQDLVVELWQRSGKTVVFVTHDVDEAVRIASSIVVMNQHGTLIYHIDNPLPRPRPPGSLAELAGYPALRRQLHEQLRPAPAVDPALRGGS